MSTYLAGVLSMDLSKLVHSWPAPKCTEPLWTAQEQGHTCIFPATRVFKFTLRQQCGLPLSVAWVLGSYLGLLLTTPAILP